MKKLFALLAITAIASSCGNDDNQTSQNQEFFNLAEGNLWVYRRYDVTNGLERVHPGNSIDSVTVSGQEIIEGQSYYKLHHTVQSYNDEFVRTDNNGHLVNSDGSVLHPGSDTTFTYSITNTYGTVSYRLEDRYNRTVEDNTYNLYPFVGYFIPVTGSDAPSGIGHTIDCVPGIGIVIRHERYINSADYFEYRLVSHRLN